MSGYTQNASVAAAIVRQQIEKILRSGEFKSSEVLSNLLRFLANHSIDQPGEVAKEYDVAVVALGRPEGFDPRTDSAVRVHAARLRAKLAEYYMSEGADDPILIEVPKGSYHVSWRQRGGAPPRSESPPLQPVLSPQAGNAWKWFGMGFAAAIVLACAVVTIWLSARPAGVPTAVKTFWQPFLQSPQPPIIVFSNHRFAGSSATGLRHFREGIDSPSDANDTYSGTGTVMAVAELSSLFSLFGRTPQLKRAELLTWDGAQTANVIFVGAPEANSRLRELAPLEHFAFKSSYDEPQFGTGGIVNLHPEAGEESIYFGPNRPFTFDYTVVARLPNLRPDRKVLILAGTNTYGCQAAAEFVTRADLLENLYARVRVASGERLPDFEALLKVNITGGVPLRFQILAVRPHNRAPATR